jgi:hypothetical protein
VRIFDLPTSERFCLSRNPAASPAELRTLARDRIVGIRMNVVQNPSTPQDAIDRLVYDLDDRIRDFALQRCTFSLREKLFNKDLEL